MKPERKLAETTTREGARLALYEHDGSYAIRLDGQTLMHSAISASELQLGELAVKRLTDQSPASVLIGGLGLGFSLKSVLAPSTTLSASCSALGRVGRMTEVPEGRPSSHAHSKSLLLSDDSPSSSASVAFSRLSSWLSAVSCLPCSTSFAAS